MSRAGQFFSVEAERTFTFSLESGGDKNFEGFQPRHMSPAEAGSGTINVHGDASLKAGSTWRALP